ncbi:hypothetical protein ACFVT8_04850 [Lysinibacillus sp. NPDC058147]|uniref:hypothetical protein n=1 Tax=unclassified Lysinibacillus TaxID=2636778 RepID=UPI0036D90C66
MEDSKLYSTQDIEKLKQKLDGYKNTLTSLKMETSIDDYLFMKKDFDGIKTQVTLLEGLTETIDDQQNSQIKGYEEQIQLLAIQIESLNQMIEKMNQEILSVLNKLLTSENTQAQATIPKTENTPKFLANGVQRDPIITQTTNQSMNTSTQPSYKMLQSLAGKATNGHLDTNNDVPSTRNENQKNVPEERHFNQQYFQSINTHPSQIYNGLYRNTTTESTFHFKNATNAQEIPIRVYESADNDLKAENLVNNEELEKINNTITIDEMSSVISNELVIPEASKVVNEPTILENSKMINEQDKSNTSPTLKSDEFEVFEAQIVENETHIQIEEVNKQPELKEETTEEGQKKEKNSLLFNFFRKWS